MRHPQSQMASLGWSCIAAAPLNGARGLQFATVPTTPCCIWPNISHHYSPLHCCLSRGRVKRKVKYFSQQELENERQQGPVFHLARSVHSSELLSLCQYGCLWCLIYRMKPKFCGPASRPFQILSRLSSETLKCIFEATALQLHQETPGLCAVPSTRNAFLTCHPFAQLMLTQPSGLILDVSASRKLSLTVLG